VESPEIRRGTVSIIPGSFQLGRVHTIKTIEV
jgi:hypothetical protein